MAHTNLMFNQEANRQWFPAVGPGAIEYGLHRFLAVSDWSRIGAVNSAVDVHTFDSLRELPAPEKRPFSWRRWRNRET